MASEAFFNTLIEPAALLERGRNSTVVFDVRFSLADLQAGRKLYEESHLPGAYYLDLEQDLSGEIDATSGRHPLPDPAELAERLRNCGVCHDSQIVVYDDAKGAIAARLWWLCQWLGHDHVAVLNGGFARWQQAELETTREVPGPQSGDFQAQVRTEWVVNATELLERLKAGSGRLIDARSAERFRGEVEPIDPIAGHVPGAISLPFGGNLDEASCFLPKEQLRQRHVDTDEETVHMCGSGVTACHNILAARLAGRAWPRLYVGSWSEWIKDPARPIAKGVEASS